MSKTIEIPTFKESSEAIETGRATALHRFVFYNQPVGLADELMFRQSLIEVLEEDRQMQALKLLAEENVRLRLDDE